MRGKKTGGKNFEKGHPGGPGRPPTTEEEKKLRKLTQTTFQTILDRFFHMPMEELVKMSKDQLKLTGIEAMVLFVMLKAIQHGDYKRLSFLLDRTIGKVPERHELTGLDGTAIQTQALSHLTDEEIEERIALLISKA